MSTPMTPKYLKSVAPLVLVETLNHRVVNEYVREILSQPGSARTIPEDRRPAALTAAMVKLPRYVEAHEILNMDLQDGRRDLGTYLRRLCELIKETRIAEQAISLSVIPGAVALPPERCWIAGLIVSSLVEAGAKYGLREAAGSVTVHLMDDGRAAYCCVTDDGGFRPRLCQGPTRRSLLALSTQLGGRIDWFVRCNGARALLRFPISPPTLCSKVHDLFARGLARRQYYHSIAD